MNAHALSPRLRWAVAAIGGVVVMALLAPLFLLPRIPALPSAFAPAPPAVRLADPSPANPLIREDLAMHDLAPLFLPTERNATLTRLPRLEAGRTVLDLAPAKLSVTPAELRFERDLPAAPGLNGKPVTAAAPVDVLNPPATAAAVLGFGRSPVELEPLPARGGYLEVIAVATGERMFGEQLDPGVRPATDKPWGPVTFLAAVDAVGLVGPLILTERSGAEEVDQHFRNFLAETYHIGQRLPPGMYRISVGP